MMLLRQFPASSMSMTGIAFPSLPDSLPSNSSVLLSLLASIVLLSFIRATFLCLRTNVSKQPQQSQVTVPEKTVQRSEEPRQRRSSWAWGLLTWDSLPTLPVSLAMSETESNGRGVGLQSKRVEGPTQNWQQPRVRRSGPAFESPLPALYQSEVPVSMAKMIMSRHTYRKPTNRPPARTVTPPSRTSVPPAAPSPTPSHPPSMV
ncbi:hypothetical protein Hypma_001680 [Hypsizygus marmoreus]|uniref:Uncharacterized protein n=1 Tax=Hypsizygus marmoreus TaxID=39966 RepID=A0A369J5R0_HYPMA|nr:hypothetical protein Hypma_001680 [Hypsizygus marmoreus]